MSTRHVGSTYRLQLNGFGFAAAEQLVPFLSDLGVETCYVSPVTRARSGSSHGYDVVDPTVLDPALGTSAEFESLLAALASHEMGLLIDIVPNHMAASPENPFFSDVLRHGQESEFASYFDIAWGEQEGKILLPVLGRPLEEAIDAGEIRLIIDDGASEPVISYFDNRYPVAPGTANGQAVGTVLSRQHFRLADWRVANREINYRRFFDINELIGVRQEDPAVFAATHTLVGELAADPRIVGVRVDHVDGLRDPAAYLAMLRELCDQSGTAPAIVVEKIVAAGEVLPQWPVEGTTGYEFATMLAGLFVDPTGAADLTRATAVATGDYLSFADRAVVAKRRAIETLFPHQRDQVVAGFDTALGVGAGPDVAAADLVEVVIELTSYLDVYRTYRRAGEAATVEDVRRVRIASELARPRLTGRAAAAFDRVVELVDGDLESATVALDAVSAWQQLSGPVAAKGVEDTAMYGSGRLLAMADVGSDPDHPAMSTAGFHTAMAARQRLGQGGMSSTSTHDSKRSHDVRCRLAVLSEIAADWEATVLALDNRLLDGGASSMPDAADRRYLYETLVGAWPVDGDAGEVFAGRIREHVVKAAREAKRHSSWLDPDSKYEGALEQLADQAILGDAPEARRLVEAAVASIECAGVVNSLSSVVIKATAPGVPDTYQGDDAWFFRLVDPDNRAPVEFDRHRQLLSNPATPAELLAGWRSGALKQLVTRNSLVARRGAREVFAAGDYVPIEATGRWCDHVIAFARVHGDNWMVTVVPRLVHALTEPAQFPTGECWNDTEIVLPAGCPSAFTDVLADRAITTSSGRLTIASALATLPVALLSGDKAGVVRL